MSQTPVVLLLLLLLAPSGALYHSYLKVLTPLALLLVLCLPTFSCQLSFCLLVYFQELQAKLATQKLSEGLKISMGSYTPDGGPLAAYREVHDEGSHLSSEEDWFWMDSLGKWCNLGLWRKEALDLMVQGFPFQDQRENQSFLTVNSF